MTVFKSSNVKSKWIIIFCQVKYWVKRRKKLKWKRREERKSEEEIDLKSQSQSQS